MSDEQEAAPTAGSEAPPAATPTVARGTYDILAERLRGHAGELSRRAEALNRQRLDLFGGTELAVVGTAQIRTEHNSRPRDVVALGRHLLVGYDVFLGLKRETSVADVFSLFRLERDEAGDGEDGGGHYHFEPVAPGAPARQFLDHPRFADELTELFRFYRDTRLQALRLAGTRLLAVFSTGPAATDLKVFRWDMSPDGRLTYIDNRGERDLPQPPSHDFEWIRTTRDDQVSGRHPHVSIEDQVFVETVGGDLTIKVEDNTEDGLGVYREPVDDPDQALDDAEISYARLGSLILLKILPYDETRTRYLVFNSRTQEVARIDALAESCRQLPEDQGIIFPGGTYLQSGEVRIFEREPRGLGFVRRVDSPNGEDVLYVFRRPEDGLTVLLPYNLIRKEVANPLRCQGYSQFADGTLVVLRSAGDDPTRVHPIQVWQTPFTSLEHHADQAERSGTFLERVGNADLVRGVSEALSLRRAVDGLGVGGTLPAARAFEDLAASAQRMIDQFYWLDDSQVGDLAEPVIEVRDTATLILGEIEKVRTATRRAKKAVDEAEDRLQELEASPEAGSLTDLDEAIEALSELRRHRGHIITLKEMRYADLARLDALEARAVERFDQLGAETSRLLARPEALADHHRTISEIEPKIAQAETVVELAPVGDELDRLAAGLDLLTDVVQSLGVDDATVRTTILERISEAVGASNRTRALADRRRRELQRVESEAELGVQLRLLSQETDGALALADTPEAAEAQLSRQLLRLEELESRFGEVDVFLAQLTERREEITEAFAAKKEQLTAERRNRASHLTEAADRILSGLARRAATLPDQAALASFFASDPMATKVRDLAGRLRQLGEGVAADEIASRLSAARDEAGRDLRDRRDLYDQDAASTGSMGTLVRFGRHKFTVNERPLELALVPRDGALALHLTGTGLYEQVSDPELLDLEPYWTQTLVSETSEVYRAEFLAHQLLEDPDMPRERLEKAAVGSTPDDGPSEALVALVREAAASRYDEGYERGVHDHDGAAILARLLELGKTAGLARFPGAARAAAALFWAGTTTDASGAVQLPEHYGRWRTRAASLVRLEETLGPSPEMAELAADLTREIVRWHEAVDLSLDPETAQLAGAYLAREMGAAGASGGVLRFTTGQEATERVEGLWKRLQEAGSARTLAGELERLAGHLGERLALARAWVAADAGRQGDDLAPGLLAEAAALLATDGVPTERDRVERRVVRSPSSVQVTGLLGRHPRIEDGTMTLAIDDFTARLGRFVRQRLPGYARWREARHRTLERQKRRLRLAELEPQVMSTFVRNQLIDEVYLPLIGDNLARQLGTAGAAGTSARSGLLLLISPPGYGKTTLMEYVASRLGLAFVKVDGPSLGHRVTSLDPADAPDATARREVERINLALEMGENTLLYLDDIQHTDPELLQKFIPLTDTQRSIEGVDSSGDAKTYDLRGKRFAVVMAGNPYTESGERFRIPDMLANRADVYNLGDILSGKEDLFALSYIENSLTANPVVAPLAAHERDDLRKLVRMARGEEIPPDQLSHEISGEELSDILAVLEKLLEIQKLLLVVNRQYIDSASQADAYRTEPPFQLQGSYRDMVKLASRVVPVMNREELAGLITDHYQGEAQTLTTGAEQNLLKLAELRGRMTEEQTARWAEIKKDFRRLQVLGGTGDDDPVGRVVGQIALVSEQIGQVGQSLSASLGESLASATSAGQSPAVSEEALTPYLEKLDATLERMGRLTAGAIAESRAAPSQPADTDHRTTIEALGSSLETLGQRIADSLARSAPATQAAATRVFQSLPPGVTHVMDDMVDRIGDDLMPALRALGRRLEKDGDDAPAKRLRDQLDRTLKGFDSLRDLVAALRRMDGGGGDTPPPPPKPPEG